MFEWLFGSGSSGTGARIAETARSYVGVSEAKNPDQVREFIQPTGHRGIVAWCAAFYQSVANKVQSGIVKTTASVSDMMGYFRKNGALTEDISSAKPGDSLFFKGNGMSHVGVVSANDGNNLTLIDGNNGNAVRENTLSIEGWRASGATALGSIERLQNAGMTGGIQVSMHNMGGLSSPTNFGQLSFDPAARGSNA